MRHNTFETSKTIPLTRGDIAIVDAELYDELSKYKWHSHAGYAARTKKKKGVVTILLMHRIIMGINDPKIIVDHINRNKSDNRRANLRLVNKSQNGMNRPKDSDGNNAYKCIYKFHPKHKRKKPYYVQMTANGKKYHGGYFETPEQALSKYNEMARRFHGEFAYMQAPMGEQ